MITTADLPQNSDPMYRRLGDAFLNKISADELVADTRLPAIRTLASALNVNNTTVVSAYKYLEQKRAVYSVMGSGTYVARKTETVNSQAASIPLADDCINFASTEFTNSEEVSAHFPTDDFRSAFDMVLTRNGANAFSYAGQRGFLPLRESVCTLLSQSSVSVEPHEIQITASLRDGLEILLDGLINPGDAVVLESPCAQWVTAAFAFSGAKIYELPLTENGPDLERLFFLAKKFKPKLFFLSTNYQFPTGLCYTDDAKEKILEIARNFDAYIIESDDYGDFFYNKIKIPLKAADTNGRVIYMKSFERMLTPGLVGYIACAEAVVNRLRESERASGYIQRSLDVYLRNSDFNAHCTNVRGAFAKKYRRAITAAETFLSPYASYIVPGGGLGLWVSPKDSRKTSKFIDAFLRSKVLVSPGRLYAPIALSSAMAERHFRISFANSTEDEISKGIGIIASVLARGE